jgi:hypothetical protein
MTKETKLSAESANKVLQIMYDYYENDLKTKEEERIEMELEGIRYGVVHAGLIKGVMAGRLKITEDGEDGLTVTQTMKREKTEIVYRVIDGRSRVVMEKKTGQHSKMFQMLGYLCGKGPDIFSSFKGVDLSLAECLGLFFLSC